MLGSRCLAADQTLDIRVLDIDLAGHHEWWHRNDLRVMRDVTWSRSLPQKQFKRPILIMRFILIYNFVNFIY